MTMQGRVSSPVPLGRIIGSILVVGSLCHPDGSAQAGRNRDGALVLHANDAYSYSASSACTPPQGLPTACADAITRTDRSTGSVIWLMAAFPDTSIPSVTTIYFGIDYTTERLTPARWKMCGTPGSLEVPDADWPYAGFGNAVAFPEPLLDQHLFAFYCFEIDDAGAADAGEDANPVFSTSINPTGGYAAFVDGSNPPVTDTIDRFGSVHWYEAGSNSCPVAAPENPGDGPDSPVDITPTNVLSIWLRPEWIPRSVQMGDDTWDFFRFEATIWPPAPAVVWPNLTENCRGDITTTLTGFEPENMGEVGPRVRLELARDGLPGCTMERFDDGRVVLTGYNYRRNLTDWLVPLTEMRMAFTYYTKGNTAVEEDREPSALRLSTSPNPTGRRAVLSVRGSAGEKGVIEVFDVGGRRVDEEEFRCGPDGRTSLVWDSTDRSGHELGNGIYFLVARSERGISRTRLTLLQ